MNAPLFDPQPSPLPAPVPAISPRGHGRFGRVLAADDSGGGRARWTSNYIHPVVARPNYMAVVRLTAVCMTCSVVSLPCLPQSSNKRLPRPQGSGRIWEEDAEGSGLVRQIRRKQWSNLQNVKTTADNCRQLPYCRHVCTVR